MTVGRANRHARSLTGEVPLSYAARSGSNGTVRFLANGVGGQDVNARAQNSKSPIHYAARAGHTNTVRILGDFKRRPWAPDSSPPAPPPPPRTRYLASFRTLPPLPRA